MGPWQGKRIDRSAVWILADSGPPLKVELMRTSHFMFKVAI